MAYDYGSGSTTRARPWDVTLAYGGETIGLKLATLDGHLSSYGLDVVPVDPLPLKTIQGETKRADMESDYTYIAQRDWSAGMGYLDFQDDKSGFKYSERLNTYVDGQLSVGPMYSWCTGIKSDKNEWFPMYDGGLEWGSRNEEFVWQNIHGEIGDAEATIILAMPFTPSETYTAKYIHFVIKSRGSDTGLKSFKVSIFSESGGEPDTRLAWDTLQAPAGRDHSEHMVAEVNYQVTGSTNYFLVWECDPDVIDVKDVDILCAPHPTVTGLRSTDGGTTWGGWKEPLYRIEPEITKKKIFFAELKGQLYICIDDLDGTAPTIKHCGYHGVATGGSTTTLVDSTQSWTADELARMVCVLWDGTGVTNDQNWRGIDGNSAGDTIDDFTTPWKIAPAAGTEYLIIASDTFKTLDGITGSAPASQVFDMLGVNHMIYFAMGPSTDMVRLRVFDSTGWKSTYTAETDVRADILRHHTYYTYPQVWSGYSVASAVNRADFKDGYGSGAVGVLEPGADISVGNIGDRIRGMEVYGEPPKLWVFKEGGVYYISEDTPHEFSLAEMQGLIDSRNGVSLQHGPYLYWVVHDTIFRYAEGGQPRDIGPSNMGTEGIPEDLRGNITAMVGYKGLLIVAIDGGSVSSSKYSSVWIYNGSGWHLYFKAPIPGSTINSLHIQSIPGYGVDRLYVGLNDDLLWLPIDTNPHKMYTEVPDPDRPYCQCWGGYLETSQIDFQFSELEKFFKKYGLKSEGGISNHPNEEAYLRYKIDGPAGSWIGDTEFVNAGFQEDDLSVDGVANTSGYIFEGRIELYNDGTGNSKQVTDYTLQGSIRFPVKDQITLTFRVCDNDVDLLNHADPWTSVDDKLDKLREWAEMADPVYVSIYPYHIGEKYMYVLPASVRIVSRVEHTGTETWIGQLILRDL